MFIAMNRFKIKIGNESDFEKVWKERETFLDKVNGFISFNLVRFLQTFKVFFPEILTMAIPDGPLPDERA